MNPTSSKGSKAPSNKNDKKKPRGARVSESNFLQLMASWWSHHVASCSGSLRRLLLAPVQASLTWLVIAIALVLPTGLYIALQNVQQLGQGWQDNAQMSVFVEKKAKQQAVEQLIDRLRNKQQISSVDFISSQQALAEFVDFSGLGNVVNNLDENPLPAIIIVQPHESLNTPESLDQLAEQLTVEPLIERVQLDLGWLRRLHELLSLGERIVLALACVLLLGVLLIIGNTLRLAIENRREEIVVVKMVGGTDGFVRRPFLYTGFWYGFGGGILAVVLLQLIGFWLSSPIDKLASLYQSDYLIQGYDFSLAAILIALSSLLGWLGAWLAVTKHLNKIQPS